MNQYAGYFSIQCRKALSESYPVQVFHDANKFIDTIVKLLILSNDAILEMDAFLYCYRFFQIIDRNPDMIALYPDLQITMENKLVQFRASDSQYENILANTFWHLIPNNTLSNG